MHFSDWQLHRQTDGVEDGLTDGAGRKIQSEILDI